MLVAAREQLTVEQLVWLSGVEEEKVGKCMASLERLTGLCTAHDLITS